MTKKYLLIILLLITIFNLNACTCKHEFEIIEVVERTCTQDGYTLQKCLNCSEEIKTNILTKGHNFSDWLIVKNATDNSSGLKERTCTMCSVKEEKEYQKYDYQNLKYINYPLKENQIINSISELKDFYNAALLNVKTKISCKLNFKVSNFNSLWDELMAGTAIKFNHRSKGSLLNDVLTFEFEYLNIPDISTGNTKRYEQYSSLNYELKSSTRSNSYDDFKINNSEISFSVNTTDQLFYCLSNGVKPIPQQNSAAEEVYSLVKNILRTIIDDQMSDYEKVKTIHDWLVMNVTYDKDLLNKIGKDQNLTKYKGFYLEGVFIDKKAVCEGISKAFCVMASIEGIPCVYTDGYEISNPNGVGHAWNKVLIDNNWYIIDVTSDGTIINDKYEVLSHNYFLINDETMAKKYLGNAHQEIVCDNNYKYFETFKRDLVIDNITELEEVIAYFINTSSKKTTLEFVLNYVSDTNFVNDINKVCSKLGINETFSFINVNNNYILIRQ